ncbi:MAG: hypothetical protein ACE5LH_09930, partial [Fidelibacterota bacterium]
MILLAISSCREGPFLGEKTANQPPQVWLSGAPPEGSVNTYLVHLFWGGWDPDGEVSHYQYAITDNPPGGLAVTKELLQVLERDSVWYG